MDYQAGQGAVLAPSVLRDVARYRHGVFVEKLGWSLQCEEGIEFDQFDGPRRFTSWPITMSEWLALLGSCQLLAPICLRKCSLSSWATSNLPMIRGYGNSPDSLPVASR